MPARGGRSGAPLALTASVLFLIVAATAIPIQLRPARVADISTASNDILDILANVAFYVPLGLLLAGGGFWRAVLAGAVLSAGAEGAQLFMAYRDPSVVDVVTNIAGTMLGGLLARGGVGRWRTPTVDRRAAAAASLLVLVPFAYMWSERGVPASPRGSSEPGALEAAYDLSASDGRLVRDTSGHGLDGRFRRTPGRVPGPRGPAAVFADGNTVSLGRSTALRLAGSMTITAWINPAAFPVDDAAIVSSRRELGYQLDTTRDRGPRTVSFKLSNACGLLMARYGRTPLALHRWYHVAGVYDADRRTIDVYVDARLDEGDLVGIVSRGQRSSRGAVYLGRRSNSREFNFTGAIGPVRIYSFALTPDQIAADMAGAVVGPPDHVSGGRAPAVERVQCAVVTDREDKDLPFAAAVAGACLGIAALGFWPARARIAGPLLAAAAGLALLGTTDSTLPSFNLVTIPLTSLAGAWCSVWSLQPASDGAD